MGILDKFQSVTTRSNSTRGFYFGTTEAEGENKDGLQNLEHYFDDYLNILPLLGDGRFIFIGRKGSGKSAIAKYINDRALKEDDTFSDLIKLQDFETESLIQLPDSELKLNKEYVIFEWLVLVRLIKQIVQNDSAKYTNEYSKLKDFLQRNAGFVEIDKYQISEIVEKKNYQVSFEVLKHVFSSIIGKHFDIKTNKAAFYKLIPPLKEIVTKILRYDVNKKKEFWLLFDDLDINFKANNEGSVQKITDLIRVCKDYNTSVFRGSKAKILIFLRDDIKSVIESYNADTAKIFSSYEIKINWYDHDNFRYNENSTPLKQFINTRIKLNFETLQISFNHNNPWSTLFSEDSAAYSGKSSFKFIIDYTFYRPRDLVLFLNPVGRNDFTFPLNSRTVKLLLRQYVKESVSELKNELSLHFTTREINTIFSLLSDLANRNHTYLDVYDMFDEMNFDMETEDIIDILASYSVLIYKDTLNNLYYNYRENTNFETLDKRRLLITLPKIIFNYFNN